MRRIKVLHYNTARGWRGGEQQTLYLMKGLSAFPVELFAAGRPHDEFIRRVSPYIRDKLLLSSRNEVSFRSVWNLLRFVRDNRVDIVHVHTPHAHAHACYAKLFGGEFKLIVHRRVDFRIKNNPLSLWKYKTGKVNSIIAISAFVKSILVSQGVPDSRIEVIYSGVDVDRFRMPTPEDRARIRKDLQLNEELPVLGNVAALTGHKDHTSLIECIRILRDRGIKMHVLILGAGPERRKVEELILRYDLSRTIKLLGYREDIGDYFGIFDIFIMSSRDEGLGTSIIDALAKGLPVIATDAGGIPEILGKNEYGIVVPKQNPNALADAVQRMISDRELRNEYQSKGPGRARQFSADTMVARVFAVYERIMERAE